MKKQFISIKLFVSSTFVDMQEERDYLSTTVFPELKNWCCKRGLHFNEVDLRWGVRPELDNALDICLSEVDRCTPFFIGIIGHRHGTIANRAEISDLETLTSRYPSLEETLTEQRSYTELEILHRMYIEEQVPSSFPTCFFYQRSAEFSEIIEKGIQQSNQSTPVPQNDESVAIDLLTNEIIERELPLKVGYQTVEGLGGWILKDLKKSFKKRIKQLDLSDKPQHKIIPPQFFISSETFIKKTLVKLSKQKMMIITGGKGSGKSTLARFLCLVVTNVNLSNAYLLTFFNFIKPASQSKVSNPYTHSLYYEIGYSITTQLQLIEIICSDLKLLSDENSKDDQSEESELGASLANLYILINQLPQDSKVLICLDGIDLLEDYRDETLADLFPEVLDGSNAVIHLLAFLDSATIQPQLKSKWSKSVSIPSMKKRVQSKFLIMLAKSYGKKFRPHDLKILLNHLNQRSPLVMRLVIDRLRMEVGHYLDVSQKIIEILSNSSDAEILSGLLTTIDERICRINGLEFQSQLFIKYLATSRNGLSEFHLRELLKLEQPHSSAHEIDKSVSILLSNLGGHLTHDAGLIRLSSTMSLLVESSEEISSKLITYFLSQPKDWNSCHELIHQHKFIGSYTTLIDFIFDAETLTYLWFEMPESLIQLIKEIHEGKKKEVEQKLFKIRRQRASSLNARLLAFIIMNRLAIPMDDIFADGLSIYEEAKNADLSLIQSELALELSAMYDYEGEYNRAIDLLTDTLVRCRQDLSEFKLLALQLNLIKLHEKEVCVAQINDDLISEEDHTLCAKNLRTELSELQNSPNLGVRALVLGDYLDQSIEELLSISHSDNLEEFTYNEALLTRFKKEAEELMRLARLLANVNLRAFALHCEGIYLMKKAFPDIREACNLFDKEMTLIPRSSTGLRIRSLSMKATALDIAGDASAALDSLDLARTLSIETSNDPLVYKEQLELASFLRRLGKSRFADDLTKEAEYNYYQSRVL